jgi:phosphoglucosamine mutase
VLKNVRVSRREPLEATSDLGREVERARKSLGDRGRVFVRYSGTEPLLRILVEGADRAEVVRIADGLEAAARRALGAA